MAPTSSVVVLRRAVAALGLAGAVALTAACTSSGSTVSSSDSSKDAPSATSGSGATTSAKSPTTKTPSTSPKPTSTEADDTTTEPTTSDTGSDPASLTPACELLPEADVVEAVGEPVTAGDQRQDECWWSTKADLKTVNLIRRTDQDVDEWRSGYQNSSWKKIDLFDEAYAGKVLDSITFRIGTTTYEVNVVYSTKGDPEQVVQDLTDKVTGRL